MKYTFKIMLWSMLLCSTSLFGCDQKEVADVVVKPIGPVVSSSKGYYVSDELSFDKINSKGKSFEPVKAIQGNYRLHTIALP